MARVNNQKSKNGNGSAHLGFEATLWAAADKLRGNLDAAEYKHVVLGLICAKDRLEPSQILRPRHLREPLLPKLPSGGFLMNALQSGT